MWIIAKIEQKKIFTLKNEFIKKLGNGIKFYSPKLKLKKYLNKKIYIKEHYLLGDYLLCFHKDFGKKSILTSLKYCKGLKYILDNFYSSQSEISNFIARCKDNEDKEGFIKQTFFNFKNKTRYEFVSGPFTNMIFTILNENKIFINTLIGNYKIQVSKEENLFRPV